MSESYQQPLKLLSIFHYVVAGILLLLALFPVIHLLVGLSIVFQPEQWCDNQQCPPAFFGWFFVIFATFWMVLASVFAVLVVMTGRWIAQRKRYTFIIVIAAVECAVFPFGTVLGVLTLIQLSKPEIKALFEGTAA